VPAIKENWTLIGDERIHERSYPAAIAGPYIEGARSVAITNPIQWHWQGKVKVIDQPN
jgi:hypothetical protein